MVGAVLIAMALAGQAEQTAEAEFAKQQQKKWNEYYESFTASGKSAERP
jgi:hypothetical protein